MKLMCSFRRPVCSQLAALKMSDSLASISYDERIFLSPSFREEKDAPPSSLPSRPIEKLPSRIQRHTSDVERPVTHLYHLDSGEVCPMLTRIHRVDQLRRRSRSLESDRKRSKSLGCHPSEHESILPLIEKQGSISLHPMSAKAPSQATESADILTDLTKDSLNKGNPVWVGVLYGLINAVIVLPVLMSFGSIIYRDEAFAPYMPVLVKLTVVSGMVHQLCFSTFSTLPFAVGQVQDAGLIFLSSMASSIVQYCQNQQYDDEALLATVTIGLGIATALLGLALVLIGKFALAQYVQMLPTCVIGGYLAFIGWFCGMSGLELMAGGGDLSIQLIADRIMFVVPGIMGGILIYVLVRRLRHMAVLPTCIAVIFITFYIVLYATGSSVEDATDMGWIRKADAPPVWYRTWDYLQLDKVAWRALPSQTLTLLSMIFVVALSSSLDVAAIELELNNQPLDYNHELKTVGLSNIVSGLTGGYTGSYIFSQSIFSLRAGIRSRLAGYVLAFCELLVLVLPFPILSRVPNFFFGSLLVMICIDLMHEWLWDVRAKVTGAEYGICMATFILIQFLGVEYGIIAGVVLYVTCRKLGLDVGDQKQGAAGDAVAFEKHISSAGSGRQQQKAEYGSTTNGANNS